MHLYVLKLIARHEEIRVIRKSQHVLISSDLHERVTSHPGENKQLNNRIKFNG